MMVNGPWQFPVLNEDESLNYEVVPTPAPEAGETVVSPLGGETWTVPETGDAARQEKAAKIVECLNSDENQLKIAAGRQTVPTKDGAAGAVRPGPADDEGVQRTGRGRARPHG